VICNRYPIRSRARLIVSRQALPARVREQAVGERAGVAALATTTTSLMPSTPRNEDVRYTLVPMDFDMDEPLTCEVVAQTIGARRSLIVRLARQGLIETVESETSEPLLRRRTPCAGWSAPCLTWCRPLFEVREGMQASELVNT
jgi:hypothetical protein